MDNIIFSIIIPIYNSEKTLEQCINSILKCSLSNIEIICVDDQSTDNSERIVLKYTKEDSRIKSYRTLDSEKGVSSARNVGIIHSNGEYILFVDSDDYIEDGILEKIKNVIQHYNPDFIDFNFYYIQNGIAYPTKKNQIPKDIILFRDFIEEKIIPRLINLTGDDYFIENYCHNKVFKKSILTSHNIKFDIKREKWEDRPFIANYCKYIQTYYSMSTYGYNYVNTANSLSKKFDKKTLIYIINSYKEYKDLYENERYIHQNGYTFTSNYLAEYYLSLFIKSSLEYNKLPLSDFYNILDKLNKEYYKELGILIDNYIPKSFFEKCYIVCLSNGKFKEIYFLMMCKRMSMMICKYGRMCIVGIFSRILKMRSWIMQRY